MARWQQEWAFWHSIRTTFPESRNMNHWELSYFCISYLWFSPYFVIYLCTFEVVFISKCSAIYSGKVGALETFDEHVPGNSKSKRPPFIKHLLWVRCYIWCFTYTISFPNSTHKHSYEWGTIAALVFIGWNFGRTQ